MEAIIDIERNVRSLLESPWNGILKNPLTINIGSLAGEIGITFVPQNYIVFDVVKVSAKVVDFKPMGRLFEVFSSEKIRKYDGDKDGMFFLQGLYIDAENTLFLSFYEYTPGKELPHIKNFKVVEEDIEIS